MRGLGTDHVISGPMRGLGTDQVISGLLMIGLTKTASDGTDTHTTYGHRNLETEADSVKIQQQQKGTAQLFCGIPLPKK